jgi:hypothetical protein
VTHDEPRLKDFPGLYFAINLGRSQESTTRGFTRRGPDAMWASEWALTVCDWLGRAHDRQQFPHPIDELRTDLERQLYEFEVDTCSAGYALLILALLEEIDAEGSKAAKMGAFLRNMLVGTASDERTWRQLKLSTALPEGLRKPTMDWTAAATQQTLVKYGFEDVLRRVYRRTREDIKPLLRSCKRDAASYSDWLRALLRLDAALREWQLVPVVQNGAYGGTPIPRRVSSHIEGSVTVSITGHAWFPLAEQILTKEELEGLRVEDAVLEEEDAHLNSALFLGCFTPDYLHELNRYFEAVSGDPDRHFQNREDLIEMRRTYQIPPYLVREFGDRLPR